MAGDTIGSHLPPTESIDRPSDMRERCIRSASVSRTNAAVGAVCSFRLSGAACVSHPSSEAFRIPIQLRVHARKGDIFRPSQPVSDQNFGTAAQKQPTSAWASCGARSEYHILQEVSPCTWEVIDVS